MKYIIFENEKTGLLHPVVFAEHTTHAQINMEGCKPVNAGFVSFGKGFEIHGRSDSLDLDPDYDRDKRLIELMFIDMGTMFFLPPILDL